MKLSAAVLVLAVAAATPAFAQEANPAPAQPPSQPWTTRPGRLDFRAAVSSTSFLLYMGLGLNADYSLLALGPTTLTVGAQVDWSACVLECAGILLATSGLNVNDRAVTPAARIGLHLPLEKLSLVDVYLLATGGAAFATRVVTRGSIYGWHASQTAPAFSGGVGTNLFLGSGLFLGAELLFAYSSYRYEPIYDTGSGPPLEVELVGGGGPNPQLKLFFGLRF